MTQETTTTVFLAVVEVEARRKIAAANCASERHEVVTHALQPLFAFVRSETGSVLEIKGSMSASTCFECDARQIEAVSRYLAANKKVAVGLFIDGEGAHPLLKD